jgi:ATP-dependent DNA ligase
VVSLPQPVLCRDADLLPTGIQWAYQLKVDGFFGLLANLRGQPSLTSRSGKDLGRYFPELLKTAAELPSDTIVAGELVIAGETGHPSFAALQDRLTRGLRTSARAASLIVFDLAALAGEDVTGSHFAARWDAVGVLLSNPRLHLQPIPHTQDRAEAIGWLEHGDPNLVEGVVAKNLRLRWGGGVRLHVKVKRRRTLEAVVIGLAEPAALVLGLYNKHAEMRTFGLCDMPPTVATGLGPILGALGEPEELLSRWGEQRGRKWRPLPHLLVAEVSATHIDRGRLRHAARFIRWRPDREPLECRRDELSLARAGT